MFKFFKFVGYAEALSFLWLLAIAMPQKYMMGDPTAVKIPGSLHGFLFVVYCAMAIVVADRQNWPKMRLLWAFVAAVLPFGVLVFDRKFLRQELQNN